MRSTPTLRVRPKEPPRLPAAGHGAPRHRTKQTAMPPSGANFSGRVAAALALQRQVGNRAAATVLASERDPLALQRCGARSCHCPPEERAAAEAPVQRIPAVQRSALRMCITPAYARDLTDLQLAGEIVRVEAHTGPSTFATIDLATARENLALLRAEQHRRVAARGLATAAGPQVPRPAGLPPDGAYRLTPVDGLPPGLIDAIPEGVLTEVEAAGQQGRWGSGRRRHLAGDDAHYARV